MAADCILTLFGKHPAWSDHMFVSSAPDTVTDIKQVFYDLSIVPAVQGYEPAPALDGVSFLLLDTKYVSIITGRRSRDSLGRSRFPLFAVCSIERKFFVNLCAESFSHFVHWLQDELIDPAMEELPSEFAEDWQERVISALNKGGPRINSILHRESFAEISSSVWLSAMSILAKNCEGMLFQHGDFDEVQAVLEESLLQFKHFKAALWITDPSADQMAVVFARLNSGFPLLSWLEKKLAVFGDPSYGPVTKLRKFEKRYIQNPVHLVPGHWPKIRFSDASTDSWFKLKRLLKSRALWSLSAGLVMLIFVTVWLLNILADSDQTSAQVGSSKLHGFVAEPGQLEDWQFFSSQYAVWMQPLIQRSMADGRSSFPDDLLPLLSVPLNPFAILGETSARKDFIDNPPNRVFLPNNRPLLEAVYSNQRALINWMEGVLKSMELRRLLRDLREDTMLPIQFSGLNFENSVPELTLGVNFDSDFLQRYSLNQSLHQLKAKVGFFKEQILEPLQHSFPNIGDWLLAYVSSELKQVQTPDDAISLLDSIVDQIDWPYLLKMDRVSPQFGQAFMAMVSENGNDLNLGKLPALIADYLLVEQSEVAPLLIVIPERLSFLDDRIALAQSQYPSLNWQDTSEKELLANILLDIRARSANLPLTRRQVADLEIVVKKGIEILDLVQWRLQQQLDSIQDPANWIRAIELEFNSISVDYYRDSALELVHSLREYHATQGAATTADARLDLFLRSARALKSFFLTAVEVEKLDERQDQLSYFSSPNCKILFRSILVARVRDSFANVSLATAVPAAHQVLDDLTNSLIGYLDEVNEFKTSFSCMQQDSSAAYMRMILDRIADSPFHHEEFFSAKLYTRILSHDPGVALESEPVAYWFFRASVENPSQNLLADTKRVGRFLINFGDLMNQSGFKALFESAVHNIIQQLQASNDFDKWVTLFDQPEALFPLDLIPLDMLQLSRKLAIFLNFNIMPPESLLTSAEIRKMAADEEPLIGKFLNQIAIIRDSTSPYNLEFNLNDLAAQNTQVVSMVPGDQSDSVWITFALRPTPVLFDILSIEQNRRLLVQRVPFFQQEFLHFLAVDRDLFDDYLNEVVNLGPLPFTFATDGRLIPFQEWRFINKPIFSISVFDTVGSIPLFTVTPESALMLASQLGMRLPTVEELSVVLQRSIPNPVQTQFSDEEIVDLLRISAPLSVFQKQINAVSRVGGLDFVRDQQMLQSGQFFGGAALLAQHEDGLFALGASWLWWDQDQMLNPVRIEDYRKAHIDLSFRLVTEAPPRGFNEVLNAFMREFFQSYYYNSNTEAP